MSFRSRLLLFFMIIVIVPMVAVALVLFSITADCRRLSRTPETTKPPRQQGFRSSGASRARTGDLLGAIQALSQTEL